LTEDIVARNR